MIKIVGSARRSFVFPAELPMAYAYYADVGRLLNYLPHICLVRAYGPDRFRLLYNSLELGTYRIRIYADVQTRLEERWVIRVYPLEGKPPVKAKTGIHSAVAQGYFSSRSVFHDEGGQTRIEYNLELRGQLPTPLSLRFMPGAVVRHIAQSITSMRIGSVCDGFIEHTIAAFPDWLAEMSNHHLLSELPTARPQFHPDCLQKRA